MKFLVVGGTVGVLGAVGVVAVATSGGDEPLGAATSAPGTPAANGTTPATSGPSAPGPTTAGATSAPIAPAGPVTITSGPCGAPGCSTSSNRASFAFSAADGTAFECSLDGGGFAPCTSPRAVVAPPGSHTFQAQVAGQSATVASFAWSVARDALIDDTTVTNGITQTSIGHACGGPNGTWRYTLTMRGEAVTADYHLHWIFAPGSRSAPIDGTAHIEPVSGIQVHVTIAGGHITIEASGNGFNGTSEADLDAKLVGPSTHPALKLVESEITGTIFGGGVASPFSIGGGDAKQPIRQGRFAGCP
jgi:hypothetical protein